MWMKSQTQVERAINSILQVAIQNKKEQARQSPEAQK